MCCFQFSIIKQSYILGVIKALAVSHTVAICMLYGSVDKAIKAAGDTNFDFDCHNAPDVCIPPPVGPYL